MAYTTPTSISAGNTVTAAQLNSYRSALEAVAKPPQIQAYKTSDQSISNATATVVTLSATHSIRDITLASNTFTIAETGYYIAVINFFWAANATGTRYVRFLVNAAVQWEAHTTPGNAGWRYQSETYFVGLGAADTFKVEVYQDSGAGGGLSLLTGSKVSLAMVSRQ